MPCYDPRNYEAEKLQEKVNFLTDLLCQAGRACKNQTEIPIEVKEWWLEHSKWDESRGKPW